TEHTEFGDHPINPIMSQNAVILRTWNMECAAVFRCNNCQAVGITVKVGSVCPLYFRFQHGQQKSSSRGDERCQIGCEPFPAAFYYAREITETFIAREHHHPLGLFEMLRN